MEKLELERMLEEGLRDEFGVELRNREYWEEVKMGAEIDDQFEESTTEDFIRAQEVPEEITLDPEVIKRLEVTGASTVDPEIAKKLRRVHKHMENIGKRLSPYQRQFALGKPFFFRRYAGIVNGFNIIYETDSEEDLPSYADHADRLVREDKVKTQIIDISAKVGERENTIAYIYVDKEGGSYRVTVDLGLYLDLLPKDVIETWFPSDIDIDKKLNGLKRLNGKICQLEEVCQTVMQFLRMEKDYPSSYPVF